MDNCLIIFIILLLILLVISYKRNYKFDNFGSIDKIKKSFFTGGGLGTGDGIQLENIKSGLNSYDDKTFDDVKEYLSDKKDFGESGLYKCLTGCNGTCVPYGPTGNAHCFPKN